MNLEDQLRSALRRQEPSPEFAGLVLAASGCRQPGRRKYLVAAWAMAASVALAANLGYQHYRRGEQARHEVLLALRIAGTELRAAQEKLGGRNRPIAIPRGTMENR